MLVIYTVLTEDSQPRSSSLVTPATTPIIGTTGENPIKDQFKTKQALIQELASLRQRISEQEQHLLERKQAEEALVKSEEKSRMITENMVDCVALVDTNGTYQYVTPSYRKTLGYDPEDMIGISGFSLTHPDDLERITRLVLEGIEHGWRETSYETRLRHKDGHYVPLEIRARSLKDPHGKMVGVVLCARDITQHRQLEREQLVN